MTDERIRRQIALRAAQLMYERTETEYFRAKRKAAREIGVDFRYRPKDLPSNREIRDEILALADLLEGQKRTLRLRQMRIDALRLMRRLSRFDPRLIGSVWTGHIRRGSDIDLHVFSDSQAAVTSVLDDDGVPYEVEQKRVIKFNEERIFTHIHIFHRDTIELTLYPRSMLSYVFKSSITGKAIERATAAQLERLLLEEGAPGDLESELERPDDHVDRFELYRMLLTPLESVKQNPRFHPEGDALYHSLQVFDLARDARPWDEEFLLAALLHDVGKAINSVDHTAAGLDALEGTITERTGWLIGHHMDALSYKDGSLQKADRQELERSEDFEDLMLLRDCDDKGRVPGRAAATLREALDYIKSLESEPYLR